jgi:ATP-dependent DNA helicase RecQ
LKEKLEKRHAELAKFIVEFLYEKSNANALEKDLEKEEVLVEFSVQELKNRMKKFKFISKILTLTILKTLFFICQELKL